MPNISFTLLYRTNEVLAHGYEQISNSYPLADCRNPRTALTRLVSEVAARVIHLSLMVVTAVSLVIVVPVELVELNYTLLSIHSLFSSQLWKANWLYLKVIALSLMAETRALFDGAGAYSALNAIHELRMAIAGVVAAEIPSPRRFCELLDCDQGSFPDAGFRLDIQPDDAWRAQFQQHLAGAALLREPAGNFWSTDSLFFGRAASTFLLQHYTQAEIDHARAPNVDIQQRVQQLLGIAQQFRHLFPEAAAVADNRLPAVQDNVILPSQLLFHKIYYDALKKAGDELVANGSYTRDDISSVMDSSYYATMGLALFTLIHESGCVQGSFQLQGERGEMLELKPFSDNGAHNFQRLGELFFSLRKGVEITEFRELQNWNFEQIKMLRNAVKKGCTQPVVDGIADEVVKKFAGMLRTNARELHAFTLWNIFEPKEVASFCGIAKLSPQQITLLKEALTAHSGEKIPANEPQVIYAFRLICSVVETVIGRRIMNMYGYSAEQQRALPKLTLAFAGTAR